jgi:potassium-dependent mechanosensitive channel
MRSYWPRIGLTFLATLIYGFSIPAFGQKLLIGPALPSAAAAEAPVAESPAQATLQTAQSAQPDKRAQNTEQLRLAQRKLEIGGAADKSAAQEVAYYQTREAVLAQQEAVAQQIKDATARKAKLEAQLKAPPAIEKEYTFADLDRLKDDLATDQARTALLSDKLEAAVANRDRAQGALDDNQSKLSQAQAKYEKGKTTPNAAELATAFERAQHDVDLATEILELRKSEVAREQIAGEVQKLNQTLHQDQLTRMTPLVKFSKADYEAQIDEIKKKQDSATNALTQANANLRNAELELNKTRKALEAAAGPDRAILTEQAAAQWRTKQRLTEEVDDNSQRLQQLNQLKIAWDRRYEIASTKLDTSDEAVFSKLKAEKKETQREIDELASALRIQILTMKDYRNQLTAVVKKGAAAANGPPGALLWIQVQQAQIEEILRIYDQKLVTVDSTRRVHEKLLDEINSSIKALPANLALGAWYQVKSAWDYKFIKISDKPITVGMAIQGLTTLILGWMFSRFASAVVAYRLLKRFHLSKDATSAIKSLVFYSMLFAVALESMRMVNIDLTAFTILGGGLAIGVGFGSQALINNFIGGLIMLAERPVRLGESIKFGGMDGVVEDVGFRCTKLRTNTDHLVTIPNSSLVNESIENIDRRRTIKRQFNIAVTYNITRERLAAAVQTIRDILEEKDIRERIHPIVGFEEFLPRVFFSEFAAESLNIQIAYWYAPVDPWAYMAHAERVNFRIMEEFERMGIDFAFPSKTSFVKNAKKPGAVGREPGSYAA